MLTARRLPHNRVSRGTRGPAVCARTIPAERASEIAAVLTAVAKAVTGSHWNGMLFFGLTKKARE